MKSGQCTLAVIQNNAPKGATHYYQNQWGVSYYFYSKEVNLWFVWVDHWDYWSSSIFEYRIPELKPLFEVQNEESEVDHARV